MLVNYEQGEVTLEKGDLIVSSTDGITSRRCKCFERDFGNFIQFEKITVDRDF